MSILTILVILILIVGICSQQIELNQVRKAMYHSTILHDISPNELNTKITELYLLEETMYISNDIKRSHWEVGLWNGKNGFLVSTFRQNGVEVFHGFPSGNKFIYCRYSDLMPEGSANICSNKKIEPITLIDYVNTVIDRIKKHPYSMLYDNCHNNSLYGYMVYAEPNSNMVDIVNKNYGLGLFK